MPTRNEGALARVRLQSETPISNDLDLNKLQGQAAEYVREAKRRDPSGESTSTMVDAVARRYFEHVIRKKQAVQR